MTGYGKGPPGERDLMTTPHLSREQYKGARQSLESGRGSMEYRKLPGDPSLAESFDWRDILDRAENPERLESACELETPRNDRLHVRRRHVRRTWRQRFGTVLRGMGF